jgi:Ca2+-binding EF-hand superfamily protein
MKCSLSDRLAVLSSQAEATDWFHELDKDGSGSVDMNEFLAGDTMSSICISHVTV